MQGIGYEEQPVTGRWQYARHVLQKSEAELLDVDPDFPQLSAAICDQTCAFAANTGPCPREGDVVPCQLETPHGPPQLSRCSRCCFVSTHVSASHNAEENTVEHNSFMRCVTETCLHCRYGFHLWNNLSACANRSSSAAPSLPPRFKTVPTNLICDSHANSPPAIANSVPGDGG